MKRQHLLRVERPVVEFARFFAAMRQAGARAGWLEWQPEAEIEIPNPGSEYLTSKESPPMRALNTAAFELGSACAVTVHGGGSVEVRRRSGPPVLRDVLRRHFGGCLAVLVAGELELPRLQPTSENSWSIGGAGVDPRLLTTDQLVAALRRPRPFEISEPPGPAPPAR